MISQVRPVKRRGLTGSRNRSTVWELSFLCILAFIFVWVPVDLPAVTAQEILDRVVKQNLGDAFRLALDVKTFKGQKILGEKFIWLMAKTQDDQSTFFVDFDEPKEFKGLRFLFVVPKNKEARAYMYVPSTGKTVQMVADDPSMDIGGTGLSAEDVQGFLPRGNEQSSMVKEEKVGNRDCYVIKVVVPNEKLSRLLWVSKQGYVVLKTQQVDPEGHVRRTFKVEEFFKTDKGTEFPREEEITIPDKGVRIRIRQEHGVFGVELPEEVMDPEKFGAYDWQH